MCCTCIDLKDIILVVLGALLSVPITFLLFTLKPKLEIKKPSFDEDDIIIPVDNLGDRNAINVKIEVCIINDNKQTFHLELDRDDFIILPCSRKGDYNRNFRAQTITSTTQKIIENSDKAQNKKPKTQEENYLLLLSDLKDKTTFSLRVRVHANDDLTGFGKSFESSFTFENGKFILKT